MKDCKITLISKRYQKDAAGIQKPVTTERVVFATEESAGQSEHLAAAQFGMRAEIKVSVWEFEYFGEKSIRHNGARYEVYRTYSRKDGKIELYLGQKVGG